MRILLNIYTYMYIAKRVTDTGGGYMGGFKGRKEKGK